jgi:PAS domain-containing protein
MPPQDREMTAMHDTTKARLIDELESLRRRVAELQASQAAERKPTRHETEEATLTVIEAMADPLILFGLDGRFLFVNRAMETMSGFERNELIGKHFDEVLQEVTTEEELEEDIEKMLADAEKA